jgi:phosphoglycerate dehydrogenase-like enzyme
VNLVIAHQLVPSFEALLRPMIPAGVNFVALPRGKLWEMPADATVLLAEPVLRRGTVPDVPPAGWPYRLRWLQTVSTGVDEYPPWIFDVPLVTCGRGSNAAPIAEFALAAMLAVAKKLPEIWIHGAGAWKHIELGTLQGKTLGLIGFGAIGQSLARLALPFGMRVLAFSRSATPGTQTEGVAFASLDDVLAAADHLVLALPLTPETSGIMGREAFEKLKPGAHVVNISRGGVLDQEALLEALDHRLGFASLDVTEPEPLPEGHKLYTHPRVHLSPHISWSNGERGKEIAKLFLENVRRYLAGEALLNQVTREKGY